MIDQYTFFRVYDIGISNWVRGFALINGESVPTVFAAPQRAFSSMRDLLVKQGKMDSDGTLDMVPLPFISILRGDPELNIKYWSGGTVRNNSLRPYSERWTDTSKKSTKTYQHPQPFNLPYSIEIWSKYFQTSATLFDQFMREFASNFAYTTVKHFPPWGDILTAIHLDSISDTSALEGGELDERQVRHTLNLTVEAWLFFEPTVVPTVLETTIDYYDGAGTVYDSYGRCTPDPDSDLLYSVTETYVP